MANRNLKQVNIPINATSPHSQNVKRSAESPADASENMEAAAPSPRDFSPPNTAPQEMALDLKNFRRPGEKTFTQRCRLFVGNLPSDMTEEDFKKLFSKYGEANEVFINRDRGFGFIRLVRLLYKLCMGKKKPKSNSLFFQSIISRCVYGLLKSLRSSFCSLIFKY